MTPRVRAILMSAEHLDDNEFQDFFAAIGEQFDRRMGITLHGHARDISNKQSALESRAAVLVPPPEKSGTVLPFRAGGRR